MRRLAFALVLVGCATTPPRAPEGTTVTCEHDISLHFHGDTSFTPAERALIEDSFVEWAKISSGHVAVDVVWDVDWQSTLSVTMTALEPTIRRVESWMAPVHAVDTEHKGRVLGWTYGIPVRIAFVVDRIADKNAEALKWISAHEIGHAIGLRRLDCDDSEEDCSHLNVYGALMEPYYRDQTEFTEADLQLCRDNCFCPPLGDTHSPLQ